ncbi:hypothetical protein MUK42_03567 [Musa troglodytarum]|uniref:Uncharacterized protein n=1 Tax=Musa troglodytarum TaxID=320322 RepID=A0A9E7GZ20_9LILI|nr:hypothetical protein MUK42_03567 [Musa troglodytarum]
MLSGWPSLPWSSLFLNRGSWSCLMISSFSASSAMLDLSRGTPPSDPKVAAMLAGRGSSKQLRRKRPFQEACDELGCPRFPGMLAVGCVCDDHPRWQFRQADDRRSLIAAWATD